MFILTLVFVFVGMFMCFIAGYVPYPLLSMAMAVMGMILGFAGIFMLFGRAVKTGVIHLLSPPRPGTMLWFYIRKDNSVEILPAVREIENMSKNPHLKNALIHDMKAYRLHDTSIRFVPEGLGFSADADLVLYATLVKSKFGFKSIKDGRRKLISKEVLEDANAQ